jgi:hypothetical protein
LCVASSPVYFSLPPPPARAAEPAEPVEEEEEGAAVAAASPLSTVVQFGVGLLARLVLLDAGDDPRLDAGTAARAVGAMHASGALWVLANVVSAG